MSADDMEDYFEPIEEATMPAFDYMMFLARNEEACRRRNAVSRRVREAPPKTVAPA